MKIQFSASVLLVTSLPLSSAWGNMGHETVAYVATNFGIHIILKAYHTFSNSALQSKVRRPRSFKTSSAIRLPTT
jgi:hypothetical protein